MRPRTVALILGVVYALLTILELALGDLDLGGVSFIHRTTKANLLHWASALVLLGSFFAGARAARLVCRTVGLVFLALTVWALLSATSLGSLLGFPEGMPVVLIVLHALTGLLASAAGFVREPRGA